MPQSSTVSQRRRTGISRRESSSSSCTGQGLFGHAFSARNLPRSRRLKPLTLNKMSGGPKRHAPTVWDDQHWRVPSSRRIPSRVCTAASGPAHRGLPIQIVPRGRTRTTQLFAPSDFRVAQGSFITMPGCNSAVVETSCSVGSPPESRSLLVCSTSTGRDDSMPGRSCATQDL